MGILCQNCESFVSNHLMFSLLGHFHPPVTTIKDIVLLPATVDQEVDRSLVYKYTKFASLAVLCQSRFVFLPLLSNFLPCCIRVHSLPTPSFEFLLYTPPPPLARSIRVTLARSLDPIFPSDPTLDLSRIAPCGMPFLLFSLVSHVYLPPSADLGTSTVT